MGRGALSALSAFAAAVAVAAMVAAFGRGASGTLYEGSPCFHEASQMRGVCKVLPYCSWAVKERRSDLYPQTCSYLGYLPVVCCPYTLNHDPPHLPLRPLGLHRPDGLVQVDALASDSDAAQRPDATERPYRPLETDVGGPLGPLPVPPMSSRDNAPDDLRQDLDDVLGDTLRLGDGSGAVYQSRS